MANLAQHLPVEIIREIIRHVEPAYIFNATAVCWKWLQASRDIVLTKLNVIKFNKSRSLNGNDSLHRLRDWGIVASQKLLWYEAGRYTTQLLFADERTKGGAIHPAKVFSSTDGRFFLRSDVSVGRAQNLLFSAEDLISYQKHKSTECRPARHAYLGCNLKLEDTQPSFIGVLPSSNPLVAASFWQYDLLSATRKAFDTNRQEAFLGEYGLKRHLSYRDRLSARIHRVDIAMLSENRELTIITAILRHYQWRAMRLQKPRVDTVRSVLVGLGTRSNVGRGLPSTVMLDMEVEAVVIACHEGVEVLFLSPRPGLPGERIKGPLNRKWINMFGQSPGTTLSITDSRKDIMFFTKASHQPEEASSEKIAGLAMSFDPLWDRVSLAWSLDAGESIPMQSRMITPITHSVQEYLFWNSGTRRVEMFYVSSYSYDLRFFCIAHLRQRRFGNPRCPPSHLAAVFHHRENVIIASYIDDGHISSPDADEGRLPKDAPSTSAVHCVSEDIYMAQYLDPQVYAAYSRYPSTSMQKAGIPQHYIGTMRSPAGIDTIRVDIRHSGSVDPRPTKCSERRDHFIVIVFVLKRGTKVVTWYFEKSIPADVLGGKTDTFRWKRHKSTLRDSLGWANRPNRGFGMFNLWSTSSRQCYEKWAQQADRAASRWILQKDS